MTRRKDEYNNFVNSDRNLDKNRSKFFSQSPKRGNNLIFKEERFNAIMNKKKGENDNKLYLEIRDLFERQGNPRIRVRKKASRQIKKIIESLLAEENKFKSGGIRVFSKFQGTHYVVWMIFSLNEEDIEIRSNAALILGLIQDRRAVVPLINFLFSRYGCGNMAFALGLIGDERAVDPLIESLKDQDKGIRKFSAFSLGELKNQKAVGPLVEVLKDEEEVEVIISAIEALGKLKNPLAIPSLIDILGKQYLDIQYLNIILNSDFYPQEVHEHARKALVNIVDSRTIKLLLNELKNNRNYKMRENLVKVLGEIGDRTSTKPLIEALDDESLVVICAAAEALGKIKDERAVEPLIEILESEGRMDPTRLESPMEEIDSKMCKVSVSVIHALGELRDPRAVEPLIKSSRTFDIEQRKAVIRALGKIGDHRAIKLLVEALDSFVPDLVSCASHALVIIKPDLPQLVEKLVSLFEYRGRDEIQELSLAFTRWAAAIDLGELKNKQAVWPLIKLLKDKFGLVRDAAAKSLSKITGKNYELNYKIWRKWYRKQMKKNATQH